MADKRYNEFGTRFHNYGYIVCCEYYGVDLHSYETDIAKRASITQKADQIINERIMAFKENVAATIEYERIMERRQAKDGNVASAEHHKIMIDVYRSLLDRI